ncbi:uncharacterized protein M421DRAFT_332058 [Didymella exigua CBS 183.55]|uniref:Uncharacterized protein n=1 Tax=Didymella exigua CBS 183.55 TaxID=1150837 RepID=A0A6A5R4X5_9PLEO|nr:uncharacterized protein M421DRAFT_332058 [Didymella exigua CBS 183.55]KAF1923165.1 hypothetical protein M421DRAFT_332058 [Didymella exigua CBS 183.55]
MRLFPPPKRWRTDQDDIPGSPLAQDSRKEAKTRQTCSTSGSATSATSVASTVASAGSLVSTETIQNANKQHTYLVPIDSVRRQAVVGQRDDTLLRLTCMNTRKNKRQEQKFKKIPYGLIEWDNPRHISMINAWRRQLYGRGASKKLRETQWWLPDEELWLEMYCHLSIAETNRRAIDLPAKNDVGEEFLRFFEGRKLEDQHGGAVKRERRTLSSVTGKFGRSFPYLRECLAQAVVGMSGHVFTPSITGEEIDRFKTFKAEILEKGIRTEMVGFVNSPEWRAFFLSQSSGNDDVASRSKDGQGDTNGKSGTVENVKTPDSMA